MSSESRVRISAVESLRFPEEGSSPQGCLLYTSPVKVVDYVREAYVHPIEDVRITFDKDLRAGQSFDIFDKQMFTVPMLEKGMMVLEIKFNEFLPGYIRRAFDGIEAARSAISKYAICRKYDL